MITVGSRVGGYTVLHMLGQGGMGQVYLAQHQRIARRAAVKVLLPELSANEAVVERFFTEARATSLIRHPGIVEVLDCDVREGQAYIVMEHLEGESLADYLERIGGLVGDVGFALAIVGQVARAVGAAHAAGIVHRDLKPDNIFLTAGGTDGRIVPKVLDFGIAKLAERGSATHTRTGAVLGTPAYMSPEQCRGGSKVVDGRSDIYSLGCIFYETLCGVPPFVRDGTGDLIVAHVSEAPEPARSRVSSIPAAVDALVMRMLAKAPADRPPTMEVVAGEITDCLVALGSRVPLADIHPRRPVVVAPLPISPLAMPSGHSSSAPITPPPGAGGPSRPTTPFAEASAGGTRVLADGGHARRPTPEPSHSSTTFRSAVGERTGRTGDPAALSGSPGARRSRGAGAAMAIVGVLAVVGIGVVVALRGQGAGGTTASNESPPAAPEAEPRPTAPPTPAPPPTVSVDLQGLPAGAEVLVDGVATSELPLKLARDDRRHRVLVRAAGHEQRTIEIDGTRDRVIDLELAATPPEAAPGPRAEARQTTTRSREERTRARETRRRADGTTAIRAAAPPSAGGEPLPPPAEPAPRPTPNKPPRSSYDEM